MSVLTGCGKLRADGLCCARIAALLLAFVLPQAHGQDTAESFASTQRLLAAGARELALHRIDRSQIAGTPRWAEWERLRVSALADLGRWDAIAMRAEGLAAARGVEALGEGAIAHGIWLNGAEAALRVPSPARARALAARVIWSSAATAEEVRRARLAVIESWFAADDAATGYAAMLRFQQDVAAPDTAAAARFVALLTEHGRGRDALPWLTALEEAHPVRIAAQVRLGLAPASAAGAQARAAIARGGDPRFWSVLRAAGVATGDALLVLEASEQLLQRGLQIGGVPAASAVDALWSDYAAAAATIANREQLLIGDDFGWSNAAARLAVRDAPAARALFARLALAAPAPQARSNAQLQLVSSLRESRLPWAAVRLFSDSARVAPGALAPEVRRLLGELAAEHGRFALALDYWRDLPARAGEDPDLWRVTQAETLVRAVRIDDALRMSAGLHAAGRMPADPAVLGRLLALAELLADAGETRAALDLIAPLRTLADTPPAPSASAPAPGPVQPSQAQAPLSATQRRAVLLTSARVQHSGGAQVQAAQEYLLVASMPEFRPGEPAQAEARLRAAQAFARSGLREEARVQLDWLARNSRDAALLEQVRREQRELARGP
jgi:hypothetical protein